MNTEMDELDVVRAEGLAEIESLDTQSGDISGSVLVIPLGAPTPQELETALPEGDLDLYSRIAPLTRESIREDLDVEVVPIDGPELLALERAWPFLVKAKRIHVLHELPGARYDVLFTQAARQVGLRKVSWPEIEQSVAERAIKRQRAGDKQAWMTKDVDAGTERPKPSSDKKGKRLSVDEAIRDSDYQPGAAEPDPDAEDV